MKERAKAVLDETLHQWGTDLYFIGNSLRKGFPDLPAWEAFRWGSRVEETRYVVDLRFHLRRFGLQRAPATFRE